MTPRKKGDMPRLRRLAMQKQNGVNQADYDGRCALHLAACAGRLDVVQLLVEELNAALDVTDRWGGTPLGRRGARRAFTGRRLSHWKGRTARVLSKKQAHARASLR